MIFFIVKLQRRQEYERALLDGPWMKGENYLHVQKWLPKFRADKEEISTLPVWVRFPVLPVEFYSEPWINKEGNNIGKTLKVDLKTLLASRGKFARICVEVDLSKPLMSGYRMYGEYWRLQYEGLHVICFECGHYGHCSMTCPVKLGSEEEAPKDNGASMSNKTSGTTGASTVDGIGSGYGEWMSVQRGRRRQAKTTREPSVNLIDQGGGGPGGASCGVGGPAHRQFGKDNPFS